MIFCLGRSCLSVVCLGVVFICCVSGECCSLSLPVVLVVIQLR